MSDEAFDWLTSNYEYGHLDEMPESVLLAVLRDTSWALVMKVVFTKQFPAQEVHCVRMRQWVVVERLRRLGKLRIAEDKLIRELAEDDPGSVLRMPDGGEFWGNVVEVSPGRVNIVGEEIPLYA